MAKIGLTEGFTLIPEGTHVFQITDVKYKLSLIHISEPTRP